MLCNIYYITNNQKKGDIMRKEKDCLGEMLISAKAYYGIQTERARDNFDISGNTLINFPEYILSVVAIKKAAAIANKNIKALDSKISDAISESCDEILDGKYLDEFPLDVFQGGGGTSTNMNANEVIANIASEKISGEKNYNVVHPNTHVNMGQSTNDVIPAAMNITIYQCLGKLLNSLKILQKSFKNKVVEFENVIKLGRTCLQDALPLTLGQEFSGYLSLVERHIEKVRNIRKNCIYIPLGGTAVGTGFSTYPGYFENVYNSLKQITEIPFKKEENLFDGLQNGDGYIEVSSVLKSLSAGLSKIAKDLRLLSSGPRAGFGEIELPAVQPGSSIMPGKINPVIPELIIQMNYQVCGNDTAVTMAVEGGELDLNVWEPVILKNIYESIKILTNSIPIFTSKCIDGIKANKEICEKHANDTLALSTVVASLKGYDIGTKVAKEAYENNSSIKEASISLGILSETEAEKYLNPNIFVDLNKSSKMIQFGE
jgi:aspartate ammonia-lyase